ncbi:MAG: histone family protein DNA-binding protein [Bacteroidetes bacterium]|jgi:nucleoid DNA-binding protein|nr:histone family protein DNA-binding protein [Bacteroidota bacterium]MBP1617340.1 histone family protein DNA-binding protein [Bacteroidota bacterium]
MNKNSFSKELTRRLNCSNIEAKTFIKEYHNLLADVIQQGSTVKFQYFGVFSPHERSERMGRNPQTGYACKVQSKVTIKFKPSPYLVKKINDK